MTGLSREDAARRLAADGPNELPAGRSRALLAITLDVLREPMLLLLAATGGIYLALGDPEEAIAMAGGIAVVIGLTIYQEQKTERTLAALRTLSSPRALVLRDGVTTRIAAREVVKGDALVLNEGDRIGADGVLASSLNLVVDESLLTGESVPVAKDHSMGGDGGQVFSGTLIVSGHGVATVTATGRSTELGRIGTSLAGLEIGKTSLQTEVNRLVRTLAVLGLSACAIVGVAYGITRGRWLDGALAGLTMAISMIPEEFPVVLTVFLALGAWRISRSNVLTRRVPAIETLGSATVLCVDKTGTLTMNRMTAACVYAHGSWFALSDEDAAANGAVTIEFAVLASRPEPLDPMERAFLEAAEHLKVALPKARGWTMTHEYPLSQDFLGVAQAWRTNATDPSLVALKGAPETVIGVCTLDPSTRSLLLREAHTMASRGFRVLAVARSSHAGASFPSSARDFTWTFVGMIGLEDPIRPGVTQAVSECQAAGIRIIMLTGDYSATALHIARQIGLPRIDRVCMGAEITAMSTAELDALIADVDVFARMVPEQKLRLVQALQRQGHVVAMTGDGVNDAPALKAAQIGIAMGKRGTDVAREAAALVLLDDNFTSIVRAVRVGRRIYDNIRKAMAYVLAIHVPIAGISMIPALFGQPLVILPLHLIFMEMIVDPACSVAFEMEPEEKDVMNRPPRPASQLLFERHLLVRSLLQGVGALLVSAAVFFTSIWLGLAEPMVRTLTFSTLVIGNLALIFTNRSMTCSSFSRNVPRNRGITWLAATALAMLALVLYLPPLARLFEVTPPSVLQAAVCVLAGLLVVAWVELIKAIDNRLAGPGSPLLLTHAVK